MLLEKLRTQFRKKRVASDWLTQAWTECVRHAGLVSYRPGPLICRSIAGVNSFVHNNNRSPHKSKLLARLLCGGQGLRGGDSQEDTPATRDNCCLLCLRNGHKVAECLQHVAFTCPEYNELRSIFLGHLQVIGDRDNAFCFHRDKWGWKQLRHLERFLLEMWKHRASRLGIGSINNDICILHEVEDIW